MKRATREPGAPPTLRDPWAWASVLALLPLLVRCAGAPLGEPVAEDFDFLHRTLFTGMGSLLDGGGSSAFWRPVAHQVYYATLGPLIVSAPHAVAAVHALLLAAGALLVHRALRPQLGGATACVAATFPAFAESTRTLVGWPTQFVDVGLYFFSALAVHEASRRRLPGALLAGLMALFCKELAVVTVLLLPWMPGAWKPGERRRWLIACGALLLVWAAAYLAVRQSAHLTLPHGIEQTPALLATPALERVAWAFRGSLRALASLTLLPGAHDVWALSLGVALAGALAFAAVALPAARARLVARRAWLVWGMTWFALATTALSPIHPLWQPNRSHFGATGAGIAAAVVLEAVHPALAGAMVLARLGLLAVAPAAADRIAEEPARTGAFMDFAQLSRLQRFMAETRRALRREYPTAAPHTNLVAMNLPRGLSYALGGDRAAQVWYRDSTLRMVTFRRLAQDSTLAMLAGVQFQPRADVQVVLLSPAAMRAQDQGYRQLQARNWTAAVEALARADSLEPDADHRVFHGNNAGYRSLALLQLGRTVEAEREARQALTMDDRDQNAYRVLASALALQGRLDEAAALAIRIESIYAGEPWVEDLRANIAAARQRRTGP